MALTSVGRLFLPLILLEICVKCNANDILGCGGFVKSHVPLDFSKIEIGLYTKEGSLKEKTECAPTNGYYFLPLYEKGEYVLKVHPPAGWSFEPSEVDLSVDGTTDRCSAGQDINFAFNGFGITGRVITAGQNQGPSGIAVQLINDKGDVRNTVTTVGGDFYFTPVIPGKYNVKATHPKWKLEPSQAVVQVKEGNTALPVGVLAVKGYDVSGSVTSFGSPIRGLYVLLYSKEESPKFRVEGCNTALLQGVPDSPICHTVTDANGEFSFGLVPAGEYKLLALPTAPGQVAISYNVKPESVPFTVRHDSLFIKNAFEVTGFTVVGSVVKSVGGPGLSGARVLLDGKAIGTTDGTGKFTLPKLQPSTYTLTFEHEQCELDEVQLVVSPTGPAGGPQARVSRWRVCGAVTPPSARHVLLARQGAEPLRIPSDTKTGSWCTFLPPGLYNARVDVSDQEQRDGLQYYPLSQKVSVGNGPVSGVTFSQLKGKLSGRVQCKLAAACADIPVTLRPLSADGGYVGQPMTTVAKDGKYTFEEVLPGSVEISVGSDVLCWAESRHNVAVTQDHTNVPTFEHTGYVLRIHSTHEVEVEYSSPSSSGMFPVPSGPSQQCVPAAEQYTLTPRGCHRFQPAQALADTSTLVPTTVYLVATAHAVVIRVSSPVEVDDLVLHVVTDGAPPKDVGPLPALAQPGGGFMYEHTLYMADGEVAQVSGQSSQVLCGAAQQVVGRARCQPHALTLHARPALTLRGQTTPPVAGVTVTLVADDLKLTQVTSEDGKYHFGPLDAAKKYKITAEKDSYVFSEPDENGNIVAQKLAEITVELLDDADGTPLQGALVSVSGGSYRRNVGSGPDGRLRFSSLWPAQYYVKPNMKEYRFQPPHHIITLAQGQAHHITLRGVRVAWSCVGALVSLGGAGWPGATLLAVPTNSPTHCATEEATTEASGAFRIRGLLPNCVYNIQLKESTTPELLGLKLAKAPPVLEVKDNKDIENVRLIGIQPRQVTDGSVVVYTSNPTHYRALRLYLTADSSQAALYSARLEPGPGPHNPGLMHVLPRLPADNLTYVLRLQCSLSKATHSYEEPVYYFVSDGQYKHFTIEFEPKVKSSDQEVRQTSLLVLPLLVLLGLAWRYRDRLLESLAAAAAKAARPTRAPRPERGPDTLDRASIDQIVSALNPPPKKPKKKQL
uniref:SFRICE_011490 n=1 Tax=Spodoptera frugiperda TaxID=7108 RepID=A0A2H1VYC3_SPOFR